jgi:hypothetical protein
MINRPMHIVWIVIALLCATACAHAATVTVSPSNMQGWSMETNNGGTAELAAHGPAIFEMADPWVADDSTSLGRGAFYATLESPYSGTPSTSWLGLDTFNGSPLAGTTLNSITKLEYYAYVAHIPTQHSTGEWESWKGWYKYPRQPISLQITAEHPTIGSRKQFWFMPWGPFNASKPETIRGDNCGQNCKKWLRYDCRNFNYPGPNMSGRWYSPENPEETFDTWGALTTAYGDWKLVATSTTSYADGGWKSPGWDQSTSPTGSPSCTATGTAINFQFGARKTNTHIFYEDGIQWENDYQQGRAYVDRFTLGINNVNVTYDFEPATGTPVPQVVGITSKTAYDSMIHDPTVDKKFLTKICGRVIFSNAAIFKIEDGSGQIIGGLLYRGTGTGINDGQNPTTAGEWWSVWGYLERPPCLSSTTPWLIWTAPEHMDLQH